MARTPPYRLEVLQFIRRQRLDGNMDDDRDAVYVALADSLQATLVTTDFRLAKAAARFVDVETP